MHHIYHTQGLILGGRGFGEDSKYYYIFTRDIGMIYASASGVRKISSKLRFILQDFSYINVDLVQGKDFWRITTASKTGRLEELTKRPETLKVLVNIARLLRRLLPGTEQNEPLFDNTIQNLSLIEQAKSQEEIEDLEVRTVLEILHKLGYIEGEKAINRTQAIALINKALKETHL